jgi:hypothetical protein
MRQTGRAGRLVAIATLSLLGTCAQAPAGAEPTDHRGVSGDRVPGTPPPALQPFVARGRFEMLPGTTLRETLERWAAPSGWTVRWASDRSYPIKGRASFEGDFVEAAGALVRSFRHLTPPPIARFYLRNQELRIVTPGDEMGE